MSRRLFDMDRVTQLRRLGARTIMKRWHYALVLLTALATHQAKAQTNTDPIGLSWGGSSGRNFSVKGIPYQTQISREAIASSPDWHFENSPPVDFATAAKTARQQLKQLVDDEPVWLVDEINLCRVSTAPTKWYYQIVFAKPNEERPKTIPLFVDFSGNSGRVWIEKGHITIWMYTNYDDVVTAMKLCDGVQLGTATNGVIWSFQGYDAIVAISAEGGKVSGMTYWTRKDFETSPGQSIIGATFYTKEKKVSVNTTSK